MQDADTGKRVIGWNLRAGPAQRGGPAGRRRQPSKASRAARTLFALTTLATAGLAHAGIVLGGGGNGSWGLGSQWAAVGLAASSVSRETWDLSGDTSDSRAIATYGGRGRVGLDNQVGSKTSGGPITLSAAAHIKVSMPETGDVRARGWSSSIISDIVTVQAVGMGSRAAFISFGWNIDGTLLFDMQSLSGQPLQSRGGMYVAHMARAESFVSWKHPLTGVIQTSELEEAGRIDLRREGTPITDNQNDALDMLNPGANGQIVAPSQFLGPVPTTTYTDRADVDKKGSFSDLVDAPFGQPVEVELGLAAFYNVLYDLVDFGQLESGLYSDFSHTAELMEVRLFNADRTPFEGQWTLASANGYDYPEVVIGTTNHPVPLPGTLALVLLGLGAAGATRRVASGRQGTRVPPHGGS